VNGELLQENVCGEYSVDIAWSLVNFFEDHFRRLLCETSIRIATCQ